MNDSANETLKEMLCGMGFFGIAAQIICLLVDRDRLIYTSLGLWIGIGAGALMSIHMKRNIEDALDYDERGAVKHMRKGYVFRYALVALLFGATVYFEVGNPITLLVGVMGLKIGAYIQPITHKVLQKLQKSK